MSDSTNFKISGGDLLKYCGKDTEVVIPDGVTRIADLAFENCYKIQSITIPSSVTKIEEYAFLGCNALGSIEVAADNPAYKSENNCLLTKYGDTLILGCNNSVIPEGVKAIAANSFNCCLGLTSLTIPDGVISIGDAAFFLCVRLRKLVVPESVTVMGKTVAAMTKHAVNDELVIYCRAEKQPQQWDKDWNKKGSGIFSGRYKVVWGYKGD